jgi:hypothetical protein
MLKKISILLSVVATLGLAVAIAAPSASYAKDPKPQKQQKQQKAPKQQVQKNVVVKQKNVVVKPQHKNVVVKKNVHVKYVVGKKYHTHHVWYGYSGHRWRGAWYPYGVGPCWIWVDGVWFWNVLACPV